MGRKHRKMKMAASKAAAANAKSKQCKDLLEKDKSAQENTDDGAASVSKESNLSEDSVSTESTLTDSDNEEMPDLENCGEGAAGGNADDFTIPKSLYNVIKHPRGEKKARRLLSKLDLRPVEGVTRVTMLKSKDVLLYIDKPDVFRYVNSDTYIFLGEVKVDDMSARAQAEAAEKFTSKDNDLNLASGKDSKYDASDDEEGEEDVFDAEGMDDKDIELVMMQANTSRAKAIRALRQHDYDVVNAIMALTI